MEAQDARAIVMEMRRAADLAMRAVSVPDPDWEGYIGAMGLAAGLGLAGQDAAARELPRAMGGGGDEG